VLLAFFFDLPDMLCVTESIVQALLEASADIPPAILAQWKRDDLPSSAAASESNKPSVQGSILAELQEWHSAQYPTRPPPVDEPTSQQLLQLRQQYRMYEAAVHCHHLQARQRAWARLSSRASSMQRRLMLEWSEIGLARVAAGTSLLAAHAVWSRCLGEQHEPIVRIILEYARPIFEFSM
jgi:hypothetical protein